MTVALSLPVLHTEAMFGLLESFLNIAQMLPIEKGMDGHVCTKLYGMKRWSS
jgi:hypothetical protein